MAWPTERDLQTWQPSNVREAFRTAVVQYVNSHDHWVASHYRIPNDRFFYDKVLDEYKFFYGGREYASVRRGPDRYGEWRCMSSPVRTQDWGFEAPTVAAVNRRIKWIKELFNG